MSQPLFRVLLAACLFAGAGSAQDSASGPDVAAAGGSQLLRLRYGTFDPTAAPAAVPPALASSQDRGCGLQIVQFRVVPTQADRDAIVALGGCVLGYLPDNAYVVRVMPAEAAGLREIGTVRWVGAYHPAYRLEPWLRLTEAYTRPAPVRYNLVVADKHRDKPGLIAKIEALGGRIEHEQIGSLLLEATLTGAQLLQVAFFDEVLWIDRWTPPELDMDNARVQGGANYVEVQGGYTGTGINAHVYEGIEATHPDFTGGAVSVLSGGQETAHGHATAGIVFGNGTSNAIVRGMAPDSGKFYTNFNTVTASRWQVFSDLVNVHDVSHTTASWGNARTAFYTSISAASDEIVFDHDLAWTQAQGNGPLTESRPEAWAKNVFSIGGVFHGDDSDPTNDTFLGGGSSSGPASDGRIKPTLVGYNDSVGTSDLTGAPGYSPGDWYANFGGTSAAAPMVGGHDVLAIEMFTDDSATPGVGLFGNPLRTPGGTSHQNRPHFPTLKALMVASAAQYPFTATSIDNRREHQGWGFPDLRPLYDNRDKTFVVDEVSVLTQGGSDSWDITVAAGEPSLRVCLNWSEPAANPAAAQQLVNNLSLTVTSPAGVTYRGNQGLATGVWSVAGGSEDAVNSIECVFVENPQAGSWMVSVVATAIVQDNHVETAAVDADYGLVVVGGTGSRAGVAAVGSGCAGVTLAATERPVLGTTVAFVTDNVPAGSLLGLSILSFRAIDPGLGLAFLGMPGCELYQQLDLVTQFAVAGGSGSIAIAFPANPALAGSTLSHQAATLSPGINPFGFAVSNGQVLVLGLQ